MYHNLLNLTCLEEQMAVPPRVLPLDFQLSKEAGGGNAKGFIWVHSYSLNYKLHNQEYFRLIRNFWISWFCKQTLYTIFISYLYINVSNVGFSTIFLFIVDLPIIGHTFEEELYIFQGPTLMKKHGCLLTLRCFCSKVSHQSFMAVLFSNWFLTDIKCDL